MTFLSRAIGLTAAGLLSHSVLADCTYTASRSGEVDAAGVRKVIVAVHAGDLVVAGNSGAKLVRANGEACASTKRVLDAIRLEVRRDGDTAYVTAQRPGRDISFETATLDLKVEVPTTVELEVTDSSGDIDVRRVAAVRIDDSSGDQRVRDIGGDVSVQDSSGDIDISNVEGNVSVRDSSGDIVISNVARNVTIPVDSSGDITIRGVRGSVHILSDSSGGIAIYDVEQDVLIDDDGAGDIRVVNVGGNFTVRNDGSGHIKHSGVRGKVSLPRD
ncbi:MAG TPA: DUF4097 family beta strand repeat-containing protein [Steroidobacteraceae bacterium]